MAASERLMTTVSTKGQVVLPKTLRDKRAWGTGTRLEVQETSEGVLLKAAPLFPPTRHEDVYGSVKYSGPPVSLEDMDAAITAEAIRRYARD